MAQVKSQWSARVLCPACLPDLPFTELMVLARTHGFTAFSLWQSVPASARAAGLSDADMRGLLADHGLRVEMLEAAIDWVNAGSERDVVVRTESLARTARSLGATSLCAAAMEPAINDPRQAGRNFAQICKVAADHGLCVALEALAFGAINHLDIAREIVDRAGCDNGGFLFDTWHWARTGADMAALRRLPAERIYNVQISDLGPSESLSGMEETMQCRRLPGEGTAPLAEVFSVLQDMGVHCSIGPEVFNPGLKAGSPEEGARMLAAAARAVVPGW
ncbi:MAG: sugar phosphate isomerase/epimerase [Proteobacteria bacterium]|nr:sugar phosphate isomerase/epimerase [Pseudomonadota bacterium]HQR04040.1 sugar phosphate isomerase/epimerase family protein [Rhodocyclaceae bacterium]